VSTSATPTSNASTQELLVARAGCVGIVSLNRPERLNAVHPAMGDTLRSTFLDLERDPEIRAIVLTGRGRAFCAGADISGDTGNAETVLRDIWNPLITTMLGLDVPIIAAVNGVAAGAGASLAFACDLRVASSSARFQLSFVKIGLMPDAGATWLLPRIVGLGRANELALLGRDLPAAEAHQWGLVNDVADEGAAADAAVALAGRFAELSASAGTIKSMHRMGCESSLRDHLEREAVAQGRLQQEPDFDEATRAFREKRAAQFGSRRRPLTFSGR
jgi:2-(1,2-epoxy-1,2-dihydrophenyl)acetyl-CoA isomerase